MAMKLYEIGLDARNKLGVGICCHRNSQNVSGVMHTNEAIAREACAAVQKSLLTNLIVFP
jgi:hypothetical protein